jgi:glycosyltransferase involved in cell wall biosynthesis
MLRRRYRLGGYGSASLLRAYLARFNSLLKRHQFDLVWIEKEALPWLPRSIELTLLRGVPFVLDYDDAVFHNYDEHTNPIIRRAFGRRLDGLMAKADMVVVGNDYLAARAIDAGCSRLERIPTVVDLDRYPLLVRPEDERSEIVIGWIGSPSTAKYLRFVSGALDHLRRSHNIRCVAIGAREEDLFGTPFQPLPWHEETEVSSLRELDIGIMPLADTHWERGKCGYKLIQYMACGLPVVASAVGVNCDIVRNGESGFVASDESAWIDCLKQLTVDEGLRARMGAAGRERVKRHYCLQIQGPIMAGLLQDAATR